MTIERQVPQGSGRLDLNVGLAAFEERHELWDTATSRNEDAVLVIERQVAHGRGRHELHLAALARQQHYEWPNAAVLRHSNTIWRIAVREVAESGGRLLLHLEAR